MDINKPITNPNLVNIIKEIKKGNKEEELFWEEFFKAKFVCLVNDEPNPKNPTRFDEIKGYDGIEGRHYNNVTEEWIETPHVHDPNRPGGIRVPELWEIP